MKRTETTIKKKKRAGESGTHKEGICDAVQAKTADKNLTTKSRPDCFNSLSLRVFSFFMVGQKGRVSETLLCAPHHTHCSGQEGVRYDNSILSYK